jgi:RHS repeat-associated protein
MEVAAGAGDEPAKADREGPKLLAAASPGRARAAAADRVTAFAYDPAGNRVSAAADGTTTRYRYDQESRLTGIGDGVTYAYDGDGLRASRTVGGATTAFTWDRSDSLPLLLQDGDTSYVYGPGGQPLEQIAGDAATFLLADQQGSTRLLTDAAGSVVGTYDYDPWGNVTSHTGTASTNLRYDGQYADPESGLVYLRARYYDPATGQFLTRDPLVDATLSPYGYANDDPVNAGDPTGEISLPSIVLGGIVIYGAAKLCTAIVESAYDALFTPTTEKCEYDGEGNWVCQKVPAPPKQSTPKPPEQYPIPPKS